MRLFVGIPLDNAAREALARSIADLKHRLHTLRWSSPESWHITLQFLGNVRNDTMPAIAAQLAGVHASAMRLRITELDFFDRAGILFAAVHLSPELEGLQQRVVSEMATLGFQPELRPYSPHITLARRKGRDPSRILIPRRRIGQGFSANRFLLYQSFTESAGAHYAELRSFALAEK